MREDFLRLYGRKNICRKMTKVRLHSIGGFFFSFILIIVATGMVSGAETSYINSNLLSPINTSSFGSEQVISGSVDLGIYAVNQPISITFHNYHTGTGEPFAGYLSELKQFNDKSWASSPVVASGITDANGFVTFTFKKMKPGKYKFKSVLPAVPQSWSSTLFLVIPAIEVKENPSFHTFIIYTDFSGNQHFFAGGPERNGWKVVPELSYGNLTTEYGPYNKGTLKTNCIQWSPKAPSVIIASGKDVPKNIRNKGSVEMLK